MSQAFELISEQTCFEGTVGFYRHAAAACACEMRFAVFIPPQAQERPVPVLYYLSGLTCTAENFTTKAGAQRYAAEAGLMLVAPDTSPRGEDVADEADWDLGQGAGFYVDATQAPWSANYQMYRYVTEELPTLIAANFPVRGDRAGICGHSMGGHGALICGLKNSDKFRSISAFAPIAAPSRCPWGQKAFSHYLGENQAVWQSYDASELVLQMADPERSILIDQGTGDQFYQQGQLLPEVFQAACEQAGQPLILRLQPGYDHSYYFIATFIGDHIRHHAQALCD
ncbi:S-formylglutathione hydrolase [Sphaerothrix gracilis]|uniref:S-formylglutathione hydrolase n=1 Tax=Sphaerothrix gracilis TaxID=3151835 RepID=UPI0031FBF2B7